MGTRMYCCFVFALEYLFWFMVLKEHEIQSLNSFHECVYNEPAFPNTLREDTDMLTNRYVQIMLIHYRFVFTKTQSSIAHVMMRKDVIKSVIFTFQQRAIDGWKSKAGFISFSKGHYSFSVLPESTYISILIQVSAFLCFFLKCA